MKKKKNRKRILDPRKYLMFKWRCMRMCLCMYREIKMVKQVESCSGNVNSSDNSNTNSEESKL